MNRRTFLKVAGLGAAGAGCAAAAMAIPRVGAGAAVPGAQGIQRWAMAVDLRLCGTHAGCRACVDACHAVHNVPDIPEPRHRIQWLWKESYQHVFPEQLHEYTDRVTRERPVPVLCNHCTNPPCVRVCPTGATWKRADGIVMMDEHRCIGCRYCVVACPYGARSFNWRDPRPFLRKNGPEDPVRARRADPKCAASFERFPQHTNPEYPTRTRGVVEKCTFCAERLAVGLYPACVVACKQAGIGALVFGDLGDPTNPLVGILRSRDALRRKPALGTLPSVYYLV
jgi:Fe-S-cluster-containing dehydrogenase component